MYFEHVIPEQGISGKSTFNVYYCQSARFKIARWDIVQRVERWTFSFGCLKHALDSLMTTQYLPIGRLASIGVMSGDKGEASSGGGSVSVRHPPRRNRKPAGTESSPNYRRTQNQLVRRPIVRGMILVHKNTEIETQTQWRVRDFSFGREIVFRGFIYLSQPSSIRSWTSAFLLDVNRLCGAIKGRLNHFLPRCLRMGW